MRGRDMGWHTRSGHRTCPLPSEFCVAPCWRRRNTHGLIAGARCGRPQAAGQIPCKPQKHVVPAKAGTHAEFVSLRRLQVLRAGKHRMGPRLRGDDDSDFDT
ncbi:hypothetical protein GCM10027318_44100 [Massilia agilis]